MLRAAPPILVVLALLTPTAAALPGDPVEQAQETIGSAQRALDEARAAAMDAVVAAVDQVERALQECTALGCGPTGPIHREREALAACLSGGPSSDGSLSRSACEALRQAAAALEAALRALQDELECVASTGGCVPLPVGRLVEDVRAATEAFSQALVALAQDGAQELARVVGATATGLQTAIARFLEALLRSIDDALP